MMLSERGERWWGVRGAGVGAAAAAVVVVVVGTAEWKAEAEIESEAEGGVVVVDGCCGEIRRAPGAITV